MRGPKSNTGKTYPQEDPVGIIPVITVSDYPLVLILKNTDN